MGDLYDLRLVGGTVVTGNGVQLADVGVKDERIAAVGQDLPQDAAGELLDVTGKLVLPGVIDVRQMK